MPAGFQVNNDDGILQITEEYRNYLFEYKTTILGAYSSTYPTIGYLYNITVKKGNVIAHRSDTGAIVGLFETSVVGENITYTYYSPQSTVSPSCTFYVYSISSVPPPSTYGLEVYGPDGILRFSSSAKYMRPISVYSGQDYLSGMTIQQGLPTRNLEIWGQNKAFMISGISGRLTSDIISFDGQRYWLRMDVNNLGIGNVGGSVSMCDVFTGRVEQGPFISPPAARFHQYNQYYIMVIDVTNT